MRWRLRSLPAPTPSFRAKREELRRVRALGHDLGRRDPVFDVNGKLDAHAWADRLGVRHATLLAQVPEAGQLPWSTFPEVFVIKPVRGAASDGVHMLRREGRHLRSLKLDQQLTEQDVTENLRALSATGRISSDLLVEEMVVDPRRAHEGPVDWKFSTFFGEVGLVEAKVSVAGGKPRWKLFDENWDDLGDGWVDHHVLADGLQPPVHAAELMETARRISASVPRPFLRVDLYDSVDGPVFGEITPAPGGPRGFRRDIDHKLGRLWEEADARLLVRAVDSGLISPADAPLPESALRPMRHSRLS
ncbi:ATP-grasp fold amidoligase family protein [uncultured Pseudokineococcus sp.]|uniref:ATP-grasp fold amidoligase family protein n=1 Tax=uncultured Pseudokineococcus sp. TaxID=1642928 RepID=UPI00261E65B0|nr:ATP-grasp fold amidoligase family protein [uncultured Pseudokineococcus sp.]